MGAKWGCLDGFWIKPDGQVIEKADQNHADIILMYLPEVSQADADEYLESGDSSCDMKIVEYGLRAGWIRVLEEADREVAVEYRGGLPPRSAWSSLHRYIARDTLAGQYVFAEPGVESATFHRRNDALKFVGAQMR